MKQKIKNFSLRTSIWAFAIPMVIFFIVMSFILIPKLQLLLGEMQLLDTMFKGYDPAYVQQLFDKLQIEGQENYCSLELYADIPFILLYTVTFTILITRLLVKNQLWDTKLYYSLLLPVLAGIFDLLENIGIIKMLTDKHAITEEIVKLTSYSTILKGYFLPLTAFTLLSQLGIMVYKAVRSRIKAAR